MSESESDEAQLLVQSLVLCVSVIVNFPLVDDPKVKVLAWTTTPWTLPSNLALCVNPQMMYVKVKGTLSVTYMSLVALTTDLGLVCQPWQ